jgi:O-antigen/teichoic acid export membrane protein
MARLWEIIETWWKTPSPRWMQRASIWVAPAFAIIITFVVCGVVLLVGPYLGGRRWHLRPFDPNDTIGFAILRAVVGGCIGVTALIVWWRKINKNPNIARQDGPPNVDKPPS